MRKLIVQAVVATSIWIVLSYFSIPIAIRIVALLAGITIVHFIWERLFPDPFLYLGARPVSNDDPLMVEAVARAKATWPAFVKIYPAHRQDSTVKFRFSTDQGSVENVWGDLLELTDETAVVYLRTAPVDHKGDIERKMTIPISDIVDWQVEFRDGSLRGGYTNQAMFKICEREEGMLHPSLLVHYQRFRELDESDGEQLAAPDASSGSR